ncbi:MAG: hypothetical protein HQL78_04330 [Magnetococcales bacterium]|nr:hypothetical protein [Magnetococcales bacterium]
MLPGIQQEVHRGGGCVDPVKGHFCSFQEVVGKLLCGLPANILSVSL